MASTDTNVRTRSRFAIDFGSPPDNALIVVPEPQAFGLVVSLCLLGCVGVVRRR